MHNICHQLEFKFLLEQSVILIINFFFSKKFIQNNIKDIMCYSNAKKSDTHYDEVFVLTFHCMTFWFSTKILSTKP